MKDQIIKVLDQALFLIQQISVKGDDADRVVTIKQILSQTISALGKVTEQTAEPTNGIQPSSGE